MLVVLSLFMAVVTGMVTTLERKQKIYQICSEHDIIIIEDDPYYYLQYSLGTGQSPPYHISCTL